jgi:hypothetical protein
MGKNKKKQTKPAGTASAPEPAAVPAPPERAEEPAAVPVGPEGKTAPVPPPAPAPRSRLRALVPDLIKTVAAFAVIAAGAVIWYQPPLIQADHPAVTYRFNGKTFSDARLYRPLAMPTRFYIRLPRELADRYTWFAVDRRREVAALADAPQHRLLGRDAVRRGAPLGLDLEFRKLDRSEWLVHFLPDAVVFSNAVLAVRMDATRASEDDGR